MKRASLLITIIAAVATASCASSQRTAEIPSTPNDSYRSAMGEDFFAPISMYEASQIVTMPRIASRYRSAALSENASPGFISLGAGDALGVRVRYADHAIAGTPISWDLTAVPID